MFSFLLNLLLNIFFISKYNTPLSAYTNFTKTTEIWLKMRLFCWTIKLVFRSQGTCSQSKCTGFNILTILGIKNYIDLYMFVDLLCFSFTRHWMDMHMHMLLGPHEMFTFYIIQLKNKSFFFSFTVYNWKKYCLIYSKNSNKEGQMRGSREKNTKWSNLGDLQG